MGINWVLISYPIRVIHVIRATFCGLQLLLLLHMFCLFIAPNKHPCLLPPQAQERPNLKFWTHFILLLSPRFLYGMIHEAHVPLLPNFYSKETQPSNLNKVTNTWMAPPSRQPIFLSDQKYNRLPFKIKYPNHPLTRFHDVTYHVSPKGHFHVNAYIRPRA